MLVEARRTFDPEFLNRLDSVLVFHPLDEGTLSAITRQLLSETGQRLKRLGVAMEVEEEAVRWRAREGSDREDGARPPRRAIAALVEDPAADLMLSGRLKAGGSVKVSVQDEKVQVKLV